MISIRVPTLLAVTTICLANPAGAQQPGCTYDLCALRLQSRVFSERVVQGSTAAEVGRLGLFAPRIEALASAGDSARTHYDAFRRLQNRGGALNLVALASGVAAGVIIGSGSRRWEDPPTAAWVLLGVGLAFSLGGNISVRKGRDQLHRAIWFYNRSLVNNP